MSKKYLKRISSSVYFLNTNDPSGCRSNLDCDVCGVLANRLGVKGKCLESHHCVLGGHEPALQQNSSLFKLTSIMFVVKILFNYPTPPSLLFFFFLLNCSLQHLHNFAFMKPNSAFWRKFLGLHKIAKEKIRGSFRCHEFFTYFRSVTEQATTLKN